MYAYKEKLNAINLYFKYESYAAVINELGYPSRLALRNWIEEYKREGDVKKEITRRRIPEDSGRSDDVYIRWLNRSILPVFKASVNAWIYS